MRRTRPPILKDKRISCFVTTMPLVSMGGTAGPWLACWTRTGVGRAASGTSFLPQAGISEASSSSAPSGAILLVLIMRRSQGQGARGGGVVELGLPSEHFETGDIEVEFGAGQAGTRVDEFDLADHAFVALAAGDAEGRTRGFRARR